MLQHIHHQITVANGVPSPATLAALETRYRQTLIEQFQYLTFEGLQPSGVPIVLPLAQIYVELKAVADVPEAADTYSAEERRLLFEAEEHGPLAREEAAMHLDALRAERWNRQSRQQVERLQRRSIEELLYGPLHRGVVILGDPGSGKSTLLRYQALRAAQGEGPSGLAATALPIFVPLAAYDSYLPRGIAAGSLGEFLALYYDRWHSLPGLAPLFQQALEAGRAVVLLDGLDEVLDTAQRQFVAEQVGGLMRQWASRGNRFAVTSRIVGYREARLAGDLPHVTVLDFGRTEIAQFAQQWCRTYEIELARGETPSVLQRAATEAQALLDDVRSNASVERLAASPLLLTMLALLRRHVGKLPDWRIDLYASYVRTLIDNWQLARSRGARRHLPERLDFHTASDHLIELAFWLQQHKPSGTARRQELEQALEDICLRYEGGDPTTASRRERVQARQAAERFLRAMRHFAGLLVERGRDAFGFLHLTFQEYFAGRALARMSPDERWEAMAPHLHRPRWREPILLCAGQLGVIERRRDAVSDLAQSILTANSPHEAILYRDLFLSAALAADDVGLSPTVLDALTRQLQPLQDSPIPAVRDTALAGLAQLTRLGHEPALTLLLASLHQTALQAHVMRAAKAVLEVEACALLRQAIVAALADADWRARQAAVQALAGLVGRDAAVRQALVATLADTDYDVRQAAVQALAGLVGRDAAVRQALVATLADAHDGVRQAAVQALAGLVGRDAEITLHLLPWLGTVGEEYLSADTATATRRLLAMTYAACLVPGSALIEQVVAMLSAPAWQARQSAARALIAMPGGPPPAIRARLLGLLSDSRGEESWPERLQGCAILLNDRDGDLSQRAIAIMLEALDYATQPWYDLPQTLGRACARRPPAFLVN